MVYFTEGVNAQTHGEITNAHKLTTAYSSGPSTSVVQVQLSTATTTVVSGGSVIPYQQSDLSPTTLDTIPTGYIIGKSIKYQTGAPIFGRTPTPVGTDPTAAYQIIEDKTSYLLLTSDVLTVASTLTNPAISFVVSFTTNPANNEKGTVSGVSVSAYNASQSFVWLTMNPLSSPATTQITPTAITATPTDLPNTFILTITAASTIAAGSYQLTAGIIASIDYV